MTISSNYPAIRPSLSLDFANTTQLDPRITFARAATGTYYNANTVAKAEENLLLRSQDYSATWTVTNLTPVTGKTAPDSTSTATEFTAGAANGVLTQSFTAVAADYTFSVYLRRVTGTGNIDITAHSGGTWVTQSITSSWARYTVTQTLTAGARTPGIRIVTSGDVIEVWGCQIEQRSTATAYTVTTATPITNYIPQLLTAPANVPRFDFNPTTRESLGLLLEVQRVNLLTYSEQFDNAIWGKNGTTITPNATVSPDGTLNADTLVETATSGGHRVSQAFTSSATSYTFSVYAKAAGRSILQLFTNNTAATAGCNFDISSGTPGTPSAGITPVITPVGNGWYRCSITYTAIAVAGSQFIAMQTSISAVMNGTYTGDGYAGVFLWGAQLESGSFATSYIPTVASQETRSQDTASMTGANFNSWYRADAGSICISYRNQFMATEFAGVGVEIHNNQGFQNLLSFNSRRDGTSTQNGQFRPYYNSGQDTQLDVVGAANLNNNPNIFYEFAASWNFPTGSVAVTSTNYRVGSNTAAQNNPPIVTTLGFRSNFYAYNNFSGHIRKIAYYPNSITNLNLASLTGTQP